MSDTLTHEHYLRSVVSVFSEHVAATSPRGDDREWYSETYGEVNGYDEARART